MEATSKNKGKRRKQQQKMTQNAKRLLKRSKPSEKIRKNLSILRPAQKKKEGRNVKKYQG
jgi:hypothetical protein